MDVYQTAAVFCILVGIISIIVYVLRLRSKFNRGDPTVWERQIEAYERQDQQQELPKNIILFTGSSSIRYWKTLQEDMAPHQVLNRGFGGSRINDVNHYTDRIVFPYNPKMIVFYAGENDLSGLFFTKKHSSEQVRDDFRNFCEKVHATLPDIPIYFISIKPPKRRKNLWPEMQEANNLVKEYCSSEELLSYIDIVPPMLDEEGNPRADLFRWDGIHMNELGYEIWTSIVKPILQNIK
ncbi:MAG: SGNH/GDSL hydrolase family protein [Candidatus Thorarchaeota archaeon]